MTGQPVTSGDPACSISGQYMATAYPCATFTACDETDSGSAGAESGSARTGSGSAGADSGSTGSGSVGGDSGSASRPNPTCASRCRTHPSEHVHWVGLEHYIAYMEGGAAVRLFVGLFGLSPSQ